MNSNSLNNLAKLGIISETAKCFEEKVDKL